MFNLTNKIALVTGAGSGIGAAIAETFARAGAHIYVTDFNEDTAEQTAQKIIKSGGAAEFLRLDVTKESDCANVAKKVLGERGRLDVLVNNAGVGCVGTLLQTSGEDMDRLYAVNVRGMFLMCKSFLPAMLAAGHGHVINIASVTGKRPLPRRTPYAASKMAVLGLTRTLAFEAGPRGVTVNSLSPGPVRGPRMRRMFDLDALATGGTAEQAQERFVSRAALSRLVEEEEVAQAVIAMLSLTGLCGADVDLSAGMVAY